MNLEPKRLAAVFFISRQGQEIPIEKLLESAGADEISIYPASSSDSSDLVDCRWAGMSCKAYLKELSYHLLLEIYFWQSEFLKLLPEDDFRSLDTNDTDTTQIFVQTFQYACENLKPEVAFLVTHLDQAQQDFILSREWMVLAKEANGLADERFGLLYLNQEISQYWTHNPLRDDRDSILISSGKLVFAGKGS